MNAFRADLFLRNVVLIIFNKVWNMQQCENRVVSVHWKAQAGFELDFPFPLSLSLSLSLHTQTLVHAHTCTIRLDVLAQQAVTLSFAVLGYIIAFIQ